MKTGKSSWLFRLLVAGLFTSGAASLLQGQIVSSPRLDRVEKEHFLRTAKIIRTRNLSTGTTNSERATLSDGRLTHDAHVQTIDKRTEINLRDSYRYNIAAYLLNEILDLNMVPVSVERKVRGHTAAVTWWADNLAMSELDRLDRKIEPPDRSIWNKQILIVRVFDQLIGNTDRNLGNLLITQDWKIWMIDHTRAFRIHKTLLKPENLTECDGILLARLRKLNEEDLLRQLRPYLRKSEIRALLARRDEIVGIFEEKIARSGKAEVLYEHLPTP